MPRTVQEETHIVNISYKSHSIQNSLKDLKENTRPERAHKPLIEIKKKTSETTSYFIDGNNSKIIDSM